MSMAQPMPQSPNIDMANIFVQNNQDFVNHNPQLAADAIQSGDINTANTIAATSNISDMAQAIDKHQQMYNSNLWVANTLKNAPDVVNATLRTVRDGLMNVKY
jgi:predicted transglutaminase-like protease